MCLYLALPWTLSVSVHINLVPLETTHKLTLLFGFFGNLHSSSFGYCIKVPTSLFFSFLSYISTNFKFIFHFFSDYESFQSKLLLFLFLIQAILEERRIECNDKCCKSLELQVSYKVNCWYMQSPQIIHVTWKFLLFPSPLCSVTFLKFKDIEKKINGLERGSNLENAIVHDTSIVRN